MADECSFCAERRSTAIVRDDVILAHLHMHSDPIVNTHIEQDKSLGPGIAGQSLLSH